MIDESLLRSNFIGRDGFRWWIGQVAPFNENQLVQNNGGGWGNRAKVRIIGYHPFSEEELSNEDLPWAQVLLPTTAGSGGGNVASNAKLRPADSVFGFFLDGDNAQLPVVVGVFGRTSEVETELPYTLPFQPYTGYTGQIERPDGSASIPSEANESNSQAQKSPRRAPPEVIQDINNNIDALNANLPENTPKFWKETTYYTGIGEKVVLASSCNDTSIGSIIGLVNNLVTSLSGPAGAFLNAGLEISKTASAITAASNSIVSNMFTNIAGSLAPVMTEGLATLYNDVFDATKIITGGEIINEAEAILAGVAAQTSFLEPVKGIQDALLCGVGAVTNSLGSVIEDLLNSVIDNVTNFVSCIGTQFVGSLIGSITSKIGEYLGPLLEGVTDILGEGFDLLGVATSAVSSIASILDCGQNDEKCEGMVEEYTIGKSVVDYIQDTDQIIENARVSLEIGEIAATIGENINERLAEALGAEPGTDFGLPECDTSKVFDPPFVRIFGGGTGSRGAENDDNGGGATAEPIMGAVVKNVDGRLTGSVIDIRVTNPGSGYRYPPFVEIVDNSKTGIGAVARAKIENGSISDIYMVSIGENYPVGVGNYEPDDYQIIAPGGQALDPETYEPTNYVINSTVGVGTTTNIGISSIIIVNPGFGYTSGDIVVDNNGVGIGTTEFGPITIIPEDETGAIIGFSPSPVILVPNGIPPQIRVKTSTGSGAVLKPSIGIITSISRLTRVIDCI